MTPFTVALILLGVVAAATYAQKLPLELPDAPLLTFTLKPPTTKAPVFTLPPFVTLTIKPTTTKAPPTTTTTDAPTTTTTTAAPTTTTGAPTTTTTAAPTTTTTTLTTSVTPVTTPAPAVTTATPPPPTTTTSLAPPPTDVPSTATPPSSPDQVVTAAPTDLTEPPVQTVVTRTMQFRAVFRVAGTGWGSILQNATAVGELSVALIQDIALLLAVPEEDVVLLSLTEGSLIVSFGIYARSGRPTQSLMTRFASAGTSTSWLSNSLRQYRRMFSDTVTILRTGISHADTPVPSPYSGSSSGAMNPTSVLAAMASLALIPATLSLLMMW